MNHVQNYIFHSFYSKIFTKIYTSKFHHVFHPTPNCRVIYGLPYPRSCSLKRELIKNLDSEILIFPDGNCREIFKIFGVKAV